MIIKRKNQNQSIPSKPTEEKKPEVVKPHESMKLTKPTIRERQERRRGDRRRGYRRIDDRNIISRAQEEANTIRRTASEEGFEYSVNFYKQEIENLNHAINELLSAKEKVMQEALPDIAVIALKAAEKILKKQVELDDKVILNIVSEIIQSIGRDETEIIIKTHAKDMQIVRENLPDLYYNDKTKIIVQTDEEVERGSCIMETRNGIVDARFSTQLQIMEKALITSS